MIHFRAATVDDMATLTALMLRAFDPRFGEGWTASQLLATLVLPGTSADVALADGTLVGFTLTRRIVDEAELLLVAVEPQRRQSGIGRRLVERALLASRNSGAVRVHLEVRDGNTAAIRLYSTLNFEAVGKRNSYYVGSGLERFDAITMSCVL